MKIVKPDKQAEAEFYSKPFYFSYSGLNKLLYSPSLFYSHYILKQREDSEEKHMVSGQAIHCLLLEPEKFHEKFIISLDKLPEGKSRGVIQRVYSKYQESKEELKDYRDEIILAMKDEDFHQNLKTDDQRMEKLLTAPNISYFDHLRKREGKKLIDADTLEFCRQSVEVVKSDQKIRDLLRIDAGKFSAYEVYNEHFIECRIGDRPFGLKGVVDNIVIDHTENIIYINDLKTTSKSLADFEESVEYYNYWLQAIIYQKLVRECLQKTHLNKEVMDYEIKFNFVVVDSSLQAYVFGLKPSTVESWIARTHEVLKAAEYHYTQRDYKLPYKFAVNQVKI
jgi:hypothetical protein